jgi:hypothetical protein
MHLNSADGEVDKSQRTPEGNMADHQTESNFKIAEQSAVRFCEAGHRDAGASELSVRNRIVAASYDPGGHCQQARGKPNPKQFSPEDSNAASRKKPFNTYW